MIEWPTVALGDVVDVRIGPFGSLLHKEDYTENGVPLVNPMHIDGGSIVADRRHSVKEEKAAELAGYRMIPGDVVLGRRGEMGRCAVVQPAESGFLCGTGSLFLRPDQRVSPEFLAKLMSSPDMVRRLERESLGTTMPNLNRTIVSNLQIALPPLEEQRRIAEILDHAEALRAKRREALAGLDELTQSIEIELFGELSPNLCTLPSVRVDEAGRVQLGRQRSPKYQTGVGSRPYLRVANVHRDRLDLSDVLTMDFDESDFATYKLDPGDILLNEGQTSELVGRPAMWRGEIDECCFQNSLIRFTARPGVCVPEFALAVFLNYMRTGQFTKASAKTSSVAHLGAARFAAMPFPLPELALQQTFAERVAGVRAMKAEHQSALAELDALFASLQSRAFRGEL